MPDHRVRLTPEGHQQALEAGRKLRALLRPDDTLHFFTSPYRRTRETTEGILSALTSDDPSPSPFPRHTIKVYEEPRLREQDFGNFQPSTTEMERMWQERADYGHFFYRIPNGESAADAYDRISGFNDSLWRRFEESNFASVCILVTHGLMTRVFLMKWYHFSVEYFEDLRNVNHCEFVVMKKNFDNGKFILQNQLRTWSELKRERAARGSVIQSSHTAVATDTGDSPIPQRRRWGSCPDSCDHWQHRRGSGHPQLTRRDTVDMFRDDTELAFSPPKDSSQVPSRHDSIKPSQTRSPLRLQPIEDRSPPPFHHGNGDGGTNHGSSLPDNEDMMLDQEPDKVSPSALSAGQSSIQPANKPLKYRFRNAQPGTISRNETSVEEELSPDPRAEHVPIPRQFPSQYSSDSTPTEIPSRSDISPESLRRSLRPRREAALISMAGRDGGGSLSGACSSDEDTTEEEEEGHGMQPKAETEKEEVEAFPASTSVTHLTSTKSYPNEIQSPGQTLSSSQTTGNANTNNNYPTTSSRSSLSLAIQGPPIPIPLNSQARPDLLPPPTPTPPSSSSPGSGRDNRAMADALGDQSDAEVTEDDEEMGIKRRQRGEEEMILADERRERGDPLLSDRGMAAAAVMDDIY